MNKRCRFCETDKPASDMVPRSNRCKECFRAVRRQYADTHRSRLAAYQKTYRADPVHRAKAAEATRRWRAEHPDQSRATTEARIASKGLAHQRAVRRWTLQRRYGITLATYEAMLAAQGGKCAICGSADSKTHEGALGKFFCVDHDHATGKARGLLCFLCNAGLGKFKDDPTVLVKAIEYLAKARAI